MKRIDKSLNLFIHRHHSAFFYCAIVDWKRRKMMPLTKYCIGFYLGDGVRTTCIKIVEVIASIVGLAAKI